ncbi:MAG: hypothetical protein ACUVTX_00550 [Bacteroidales bacterium]
MRRKNNIAGSVIAIIVCIVVFLLFFRQRAPFGRNNTAFAVKENTEISKVVFFEGDRKLVLVKNREEEWIVERGNTAREEAVFSLLRILKEMKIKSPVASETFLDEIARKKIEPVRVNVYGGRRLRKSYFVYRTDSNIYGNIMKMRSSSKPYIMYVPGYEIDIGIYFTASRLFWQPFIVFNFLPSEIESIRVDNMTDSASSFKILCTGGNITLMSPDSRVITVYDSIKVRRYISYFTYIPFERWATELSPVKQAEIKSSEPLYRINVKKNNGISVQLTIWEKVNTSDDGYEVRDTDRVWAKTDENEEIFIMRYFDIDPVLKNISYFFGD